MEIDQATIAVLAEIIHERYRTRFEPSGPPWADLSEDQREANRAQARDIPAKLASVGAQVEPGTPGVPFAFTPDEIEELARAEHERWVSQREEAGWTYGPYRDIHERLHPSLVPWAELADEEREKDRAAIRAIPDILAEAGMAVVRSAR
jgi:hypothetical protein